MVVDRTRWQRAHWYWRSLITEFSECRIFLKQCQVNFRMNRSVLFSFGYYPYLSCGEAYPSLSCSYFGQEVLVYHFHEFQLLQWQQCDRIGNTQKVVQQTCSQSDVQWSLLYNCVGLPGQAPMHVDSSSCVVGLSPAIWGNNTK